MNIPYSQLFALPVANPTWFQAFSQSVATNHSSAPRGPESRALTALDLPSGVVVKRSRHYPAYLQGPIGQPLNIYGMSYCAALALINHDKGWHHLAHVSHMVDASSLGEHLRKLDRQGLLAGAQIYILPGTALKTIFTIREIMLGLIAVNPEYADRVQFVHHTVVSQAFDLGLAVFAGDVGFVKDTLTTVEAENSDHGYLGRGRRASFRAVDPDFDLRQNWRLHVPVRDEG